MKKNGKRKFVGDGNIIAFIVLMGFGTAQKVYIWFPFGAVYLILLSVNYSDNLRKVNHVNLNQYKMFKS